jgi:hypothetical protein
MLLAAVFLAVYLSWVLLDWLSQLVDVFWKSALIMASCFPRARAEVDRKKRRAADTTISCSYESSV